MGLQDALTALARLRPPQDTRLSLWVGDSDTTDSAKHAVSTFADTFPYPLHYVSVPEGAVHAHNALLECLLANKVDYIAGCDDDAVVMPDWLETLYAALHKWQASVVTDYIRLQFSCKQVPNWLAQHAEELLYIRPLRAAQEVSFARTGNVLLAAKIATDLRFDERFTAYSYDTHFFLRAHKAGAKIVGLAAYKVHETWPEARASFRFFWQRHYAIGKTSSYIAQEVYGIKGCISTLSVAIKKGLYAPFHPWVAWGSGKIYKRPRALRFCFAQGILLFARCIGHLAGMYAFTAGRKRLRALFF